MPQDVISEFYKDVIEPKKYFASEQEFRGILNDNKSRNDFFNDVIKAENIFTDLSEFENTLGLKKKEDGGIPYRTPSAPVAPSFGTPSVVEASEQLESQSKLTPPQKGGVGKLDLSKGVPVKPLSGDMPIGQLKVEKDLQRIQQSVPKVGRETMYRNAIKSNENKARLAEEKMLQIQPLLQEVDNIQQAGGEVPQELANQYNNALPTYNALLEQRNKSIDNIEYFNNALEGNRQLEIGLTDSGFRSRFVNQGLDNLGSLLYNSIAGTARMLKGATPPHLAVQAELAEKIAQRAGNKAAARAEYSTALMDEKDNYLGKEIGQIFDEKGLSGATEYALKKFTESLPITLGIMGASATGTGGAIIANTALFGGSANQKYEELKDRTDMTEEQKTFNAIGYGGAELLFEGVLSSGMGVVYKQMIKSMGKEAAEKAIKKNLVDLITNGVKKYMPLSGAVVEGVGEGATQLTQNIIDKYTDPTKKDMDVMSGVADATAIGFAGGGAMASPTLLTYVNRSKNVEKNKEIEKKREAIQTELSKPVSEATKEILQDTDNKLMQEQNELVIEDVKDLTEKLPEEQKEEVKGLAEDRRQIEQAISETESEEVKSELENKSKQIGEQIDNIYERAKEPISRGTDVNKEGLGVAVETGAQGVEGEGVSGAEVEATTKALERVDESKLISGNDVWGNATNAGSENNDFIENMEEYESQIKGRQYLKVPISIDLLRANDKDLNEYLNDIDTSAKKRKIETPIIVGDAERGAFETTKDGVIDGFHRTEQAIINGEKNIIAFVPINSKILSEAYHKAKVEGSNPELVKAVETLINKEYATQKIKQPKGVRTEPKGGIKGGETKTPSVSDSVQRTKESEKEREVRGEKPPTPEERARQVEILDTEKKIAQLEKDMRTAPVKPRRGVASQKQIRIQIRNYKDQLRELKGLPPRRKPTDSVLRRNLRAFSTQVDENNLPHEERVVLDAIGRLSATDRDIVNLDGNAKLRNQNALKKTGGDSIDLIVSDYINENDLDSEMAGDLRDAIISFVSKGDVYAFLNRIKEREAQTDPDAIREDEYYNYGYGVAEELFLTDEEVSQLEYEIGELQDLTQEEYEQLKKQFTEESLGEAGERTDIAEGKTTIGEKKPIAGNRIFNEPLKGVKEIADRYFQRVFGKQRPSFKGITKLDKKRAKRISDAFIAMKNEPNNPLVKEAYEAMAKETLEQYKDFLEAGYVVEINNKEPYNSSQEMIEDLRENKRIKIYSTESGFGNIKITDKQREENPLLRDSGYKDVNGKPLLVNDVFRAIHDFFGHSELGNGFGAIGEENAWNIHARMYSPIARRAMTTETRGQNSFVNFSGINDEIKSLRDKARELRKQGKNKEAQEIVDKIFEEGAFAEQKMGLLPEEFSQIEGVEEEVTPEAQVAEVAQKTGITPKNLRDLYKINRELFGLDRIKSLASAVAMDRMVGAMAKRAGVTKEQMYGRLKFEKASEEFVRGLSDRAKVLWQIVGENAQLAQDVRDNLQVARDMETAGKDAKTIRLATGWEKGKDGKWRYEIFTKPPFNVKLNLKFNQPKVELTNDKEATHHSQKLGDIINFPQLFEAYPKLKNLQVDLYLGGSDGVQGSYSSAGEYMLGIELFAENEKLALSGLLHEIQHAIQDIEGFAKGGSPESTFSMIEKQLEVLSNGIDDIEKNVEKYGWDKWIEVSGDTKELLEQDKKLQKRLSDEVLKGFSKGKFDIYQRLAGEVEARNVQTRMAMTPEQRRETLLSETEDVARDEQIVLFDSVGIQMQVDAWHGSPYQFDKFTTQAIGTGEGAQAFGWGLYFTDLESIAKGYAESLAKQKQSYLYKGNIVFGDGMYKTTPNEALEYDIAAQIISDGGTVSEFSFSKAKERLKDYFKADQNETAISKLEDIKFSDFSQQAPSKNLYKVSINKGKSPSEYNWLEWDKPLTKESIEKIKKSLIEKGFGNTNTYKIFNNEDALIDKASDMYRHLSNLFAREGFENGDKQASLFLLENGIDGIKYPAESISRGATSDTARGFNYVVFDENAVSIEEVIKFQKDAEKARGAMMISMDGQAVIYALTDPNVSTPLHEMAHVFEHYLTEGEKSVIQQWAKTKGWTTETSEAFARGFEKYLADGKAPTPVLQKVFEKFKQWLTDIYNGIKGSEIDIELNEQMREIYAQMLGKEAVTPTKAERKAIASAKIDEVANALKDILPKIEGEKLGVGQDEIIDVIAKAVKALVNAGIEINEAIKQVKALLSEAFDGVEGISDTDIKDRMKVTERLTPKSREEQNQKAQSYGFKNASHALNSVNKETGETYETFESIPDSVLEEVAVAKGLTEVSEDVDKIISEIDQVITGKGDSKKMAKSLIAGLKRSEKYSQEEKDRITEKVGEFYLTQSTENLEEIGQAFIDAIGSLEEAAKEAMLPTSKMLPTVRIFVLGQSILNAKKLQDRATSKAEKERLADYQNDLFDAMDEYLREFGRAIQYTSRFYMPSALAATRKEVKKIEKTNKLRNPQVNKSAKAVKDIVEDKADLKDSVNEAVEDALEGSQKTIESLQKEIDALRKQIAGGRKGSKGNPINLGVTKQQVKDARNRLLNKAYANAPLNPEFWKDMGILAADAIQEGFRKVGDFYDYMRKALNGKYSDAYGDVYLKARDKALDLGAKASEFSTDEEVESEIDRIQKESDAEKITRLTAAKAKLAAKKSKKEADAAKIAANRIISDAKRELNNEATKKEKDAINKITDVVAKKAKELSKSQNKPIGNNVADLVKFAFEQADNGRKIWNEAQKEVYSIIEKDTKLTNEEKQDLINFLDKYRDGVFDILLTKGQKDRIIKEKLIEAGYAAQKGGRVVLNLEPIIAKVRTIDDAVKAIVKSISKETRLTEAELSDFSNAIKVRLMDIVAEKKLNKINAYLKKNEPRMAAGLIGNKKRKTRVQKLLELYNAGGLSDKRVKEVLAKELGIISFTKEDEAWLENKFEEADKAPIGAELEKIEEEIQAYLEHKTEGIFGKTLFDRMQSRLLSSPLTFVKNLSGFADTLTMAIQQTVLANKGLINPKNWKDGKFDANTLKVLGKTIQMALSTSMDIAINGGVDLGTAFSESTGTKEGTPRVRYLEYTQTTVPDLYVFMGGRKINLNVYNVALKNEKLVGRSLAFTDTWNQLMLQEMKTYTYIKNKLMANDPLLTDKQASQKAYDIMYAVDIEQAKAETAEEFESRGIVLDMSKRSDLYRFNRRAYEKVVQAREEAVVKAAAEFAGRFTYKVSDVGATTPVVFIINNIKKVLSMAASETRALGKKYPESYKFFEALASSLETFTDTLFTTTMPFVNGVANILEKGLELYPPYGIAKGLGYLTTGAFAQKISKDKNFADNLYSKSGEFFVRAIIGLAITEMLKSMADSDDDDKPALYGEGDEDYRKGQAIKTLRPPNTIIVKGNPINLDYLGSFGVSLKAQAALLDLERYSEKYSKMDEKDRLAAKSMSAASSILLGAYSKGFYDLLKGEANLEAKGAEYLTRLVIPFTSGVRQAYQVANPKAKRPIGFAENLAKYSGLVAGWSLNRLAFDYRGREYRTGQLYTGSPDAFIGMFAEMDKLADNYDKLILGSTGYDIAFTGFAKTDPKYYVVDKETGKEREMTDEEYYDVMKKKNQEFDKLVKQELSDPSIQEDMRSSVKVAKEVIGKLNSAAKVKAFQDVFGELPIAVQEEEKLLNEE
jgi:hypothetical protein